MEMTGIHNCNVRIEYNNYLYIQSPEPASECNNQFNWGMLLLGLKKCHVVRGTCMHDYIGTLSQCLLFTYPNVLDGLMKQVNLSGTVVQYLALVIIASASMAPNPNCGLTLNPAPV